MLKKNKKPMAPDGTLAKPYRIPLGVRAGKWFGNFKSPFVVIMFLVLIIQSLTTIFSLYWMFSTSLKNQIEFRIDNVGLPPNWRFENYVKAFDYLYVIIRDGAGNRKVYLLELLYNSLVFAFGHTFIVILVHAMGGYVVAKFSRFGFVRFVQSVIIILMVIPQVSSLAASLDWNKQMGVYDNLPMVFYTCIALFDSQTLYFLGAYSAVHNSYIEAAKIDGAGNYRILFTIAMPLIRTVITILSVNTFIGFWNNYMTPYLYLPSTPTMAVALLNFSQSTINAISSEPMQMAASAMVCIPCLILFFIFKDKMIGNLTMGGIKG